MGRTKRVFTKEFKEEAVTLALAGTRTASEVATSLGISQSLLCKWMKASEEEGSDAFRGHGKRTAAEDEVHQLRMRVKTLEQELEFIKKVSRYFARDQK